MNLAGKPWLFGIAAALLLAWCAGMFARGFWTPDEPREADIAWRMSWQTAKSVPLLAGDAFCEKPPLTYWAAALPIDAFGMHAWSARLPNLLYAVLTALSVGLLGRRLAGPLAGLVAVAAVSTFLLAYQVAIWFATDAPLLAFTSVALLGLHQGFRASTTRQRLTGYSLMHAALALGFLSKSAAGWLVPALCLGTMIVWERRWRELLRWELYAGLALQAALILSWVWSVYAGPEGIAHLKVFFWNNLAGRFTSVEAPAELQYANAHRNSPGKYLLELPGYLWPWTLLVMAALRKAWMERGAAARSTAPHAGTAPHPADGGTVRFAIAASLPSIALLSFAATARNVYLGPAMPGFALLLGWWAARIASAGGTGDVWDKRALKATASLLFFAAALAAVALTLLALEAAPRGQPPASGALGAGAAGIALAAYLAGRAWRRSNDAQGSGTARALGALFFSLCSLLILPAWSAYGPIDRWQNLAQLGAEIKADASGHPLILLAPDETTRAFVDMYVRHQVLLVPEADETGRLARLGRLLAGNTSSRVLVQIEGREYSAFLLRLKSLFKRRQHDDADPWSAQWLDAAHLRLSKRYALPNGRRYALLEPAA